MTRSTTQRKIIHVDMDAFYASVEQRDSPSLRGRPVIVAKRSPRAVVCAASYEAREYGIHSAMPAMHAVRLCPHAQFAPPDFARYKAVSGQIRAIFERYSDHIEPLSLDEAYIDVTEFAANNNRTATEIAQHIRAAILAETDLTASAGIAPNKFVAKIASDQNKPNGQCVVRPGRIDEFLLPLDIGKIPGVGPAMRARLAELDVTTIADLRTLTQQTLADRFGRRGTRLFELARGRDDRPVESRRAAVQVSSEDTLAENLALDALAPHIERLADKVWASHRRKQSRIARTVTLKLKTANFEILTRSHTPRTPPDSAAALARLSCDLRRRVDRSADTRYRLVGVGLSGFIDDVLAPRQASLFDA